MLLLSRHSQQRSQPKQVSGDQSKLDRKQLPVEHYVARIGGGDGESCGHASWVLGGCAALSVGSAAQARFWQPDPVGPKDDTNLYSYTHNNPLNGTDPTGKDEVDVFRPFAGGLAYHEAEFVGNNKTGWTYISKDGAIGGGAAGPSKYTIISVPSLKDGLAAASKDGYTSGYQHGATPAQDAANIKAAEAAAKTDYNVVTCNCGQAVGAGERAAGTPGYSGPSPNPKDAAAYEGSQQGRQAGWTPVALPPPPPPTKQPKP